MTPDPKWLEIFKLNSDTRLGLFITCLLFLLLRHWGWLPPYVPDWMSLPAFLGLLLFGCLFLVELLPAVFDLVGTLVLWLRQRRRRP
jgi:hypothetical protein